jgi:NAD(P)H-dependent FMN reductase
MLKQVLTALKVMPVPEAVNIPFIASHLDDDKRLKPTEQMDQSATAMLDEILKWTQALQPIRAK